MKNRQEVVVSVYVCVCVCVCVCVLGGRRIVTGQVSLQRAVDRAY